MEIDQPALISLFEEKEIKPCDHMMDLFAKSLGLFIKFKAGVEKMKQVKIPHPFQGRKGIFLLKDEDEFRKNSPPERRSKNPTFTAFFIRF